MMAMCFAGFNCPSCCASAVVSTFAARVIRIMDTAVALVVSICVFALLPLRIIGMMS